MTRRMRRAGLLIGALIAIYAVKLAGDFGAEVLVGMGSRYECRDSSFFNGSDCVRISAVLRPTLPCPEGWLERDGECRWPDRY